MLQTAREKLGLTQADVADKLGFDSVQFVSNLERGIAPIPPKHFKALAQTLKITTKQLLDYNVARYIERMKREMNRG